MLTTFSTDSLPDRVDGMCLADRHFNRDEETKKGRINSAPWFQQSNSGLATTIAFATRRFVILRALRFARVTSFILIAIKYSGLFQRNILQRRDR